MNDDMSNILNNFKNILNSDSSNNTNTNASDTTNSNQNDSNLNITPEMLSNLANAFSQSNTNDNFNNNTESNSTSNESSYKENTNENNHDNNEQSNTSDFFKNFDITTILKMKNIIENLNKKDDPRSKLLYSLKPYLRETKQKKIDQYINLFKITEISSLLRNEKGDKN